MALFAKRIVAISAVLAGLWSAIPAYGLSITFDNGTGGTLTIVDNGAGDLDATVGIIDFATPAIGGTFEATGTLTEVITGFVPYIVLSGSPGTFRNVGAVAATFSVQFSSSAFPPITPFVRYRLGYFGSAEDPTPDDLEIPAHQVSGWLNGFSIFLSTLVGAPIPLTAPGGQPVVIGPLSIEGFVPGTGTTIDGELLFSPGPGDQISLPSSFEIVLNEDPPLPVDESTWGKIKAMFGR